MSERTPRKGARRRLFDLHAALGLTVGAVLAFVALTGSLAVFRREVDWLSTPALRVTPSAVIVDYDAAWRGAHEGHPPAEDEFLWELRRPEGPRYAYVALFRRGNELTEVFVDPRTGRARGERVMDVHLDSVAYALRQLHVRLWLGVWGRALVGLLGVFMVALSLTGWWLSRRRDGGARRTRGTSRLHLVVGRWTLVFHLVTGVSGAVLGLEVLPHLLRPRARPAPVAANAPQPLPHLAGPEFYSLEEAARRSEGLAGGSVARVLRFRQKPHVVTAHLDHGSPWIARGASEVHVDLLRGRLVAFEDARAAGAADRAYNALDPLHFGYFGEAWGTLAGYAVRVAWSLLGLTPAGLMVTGTLLWRRRALKREARRRPTPVAALVEVEA